MLEGFDQEFSCLAVITTVCWDWPKVDEFDSLLHEIRFLSGLATIAQECSSLETSQWKLRDQKISYSLNYTYMTLLEGKCKTFFLLFSIFPELS